MGITSLNYCLSDKGQFVTDEGNAGRTTLADMQAAFARFAKEPIGTPLVVHFHGGLVSQQNGIGDAQNGVNGGLSLLDAYTQAGGYPYFFIWKAGLAETIFDILHDNLSSVFGNAHVSGLIQAVHNSNTPANQALAVQSGGDTTVRVMALPLLAADDMPPPALAQKLETYFKADPDAQYFAALLSSTRPVSAMSLVQPVRATEPMSDDEAASRIWTALSTNSAAPQVGSQQPMAIPTPSPIALFVGLAKIAYRVILRTIQGRAHPGICTATEEVLRAFFLAYVGQNLWGRMKQDCQDAFNAGATPVGTAFLDCLSQYVTDNQPPRIILIGHSAGTIFVERFLENVVVRKMDSRIVFDVIFLAAAVRDSLFNAQLGPTPNARIAHFRSFGMSDSLEGSGGLMQKSDAAGQLVDIFYPASLLYLIAGILEEDEVDSPLVGMQRYILNNRIYGSESGVADLESFIVAHPDVWSPTSNAPNGYGCQANYHGGFPNDPLTLQSMMTLIQGWV